MAATGNQRPTDQRFISELFPRASSYHPDWILASVSGGANVLWLTEWLTRAVDLQPDMKVLDLGCGRAASSIFLHREFGVDVWATDLWFSAEENAQRVRDADMQAHVFPVHADARSLPFSTGFFDAIVSIDAFPYFGTDDLYLNYLARFVKPGGQIGIASAGLVKEFGKTIPDHLRSWWTDDLWGLHSAAWWRRHWTRVSFMTVETADLMPNGWQRWLDWHRAVAPDNAIEVAALEEDRGRALGYVRVVGRRRVDVAVPDHIESLPPRYLRTPLIRERE